MSSRREFICKHQYNWIGLGGKLSRLAGIKHTYAEFTLHDFQSHQITAVFTLHDNLRYHSVAAVFTLHDGSATGGFTLHDFTQTTLCDPQATVKRTGEVKEITQDHADKFSPNTQ